MQNIIIALIGALGSAAGAVAGIFINTRLITYRIEQLEQKVNKHNNIIERMYELEKKEEVTNEKIKVINHRIDDLEDANGNNKPLKET